MINMDYWDFFNWSNILSEARMRYAQDPEKRTLEYWTAWCAHANAAACLATEMMLDSWRPIETMPQELKDGRRILGLIPCYGHYNEVGKLRGYLPAIVEWRYGQWNEIGVGKREPAYFMEIPREPIVDRPDD